MVETMMEAQLLESPRRRMVELHDSEEKVQSEFALKDEADQLRKERLRRVDRG